MKKGNVKALLPIGVFLAIYLGLGLVFQYGMKLDKGFYKVPIVVAFLIALLTACLQNRKLNFNRKLDLMAKGVGNRDIMTMVLIFMVSGIFVGVAGNSGADSVAYSLLRIIPARYAVVVLFIASSFVSLAMGTSVGTISLITPIAVSISNTSGFAMPLCVGSVISGAMFGDNLSFISDTTIAACNGQGCAMKDKFRENFLIALPAALISIALILAFSSSHTNTNISIPEYDLIHVIPYVLVLLGGIIGFNVFAVLLAGIMTGSVITIATGAVAWTDLMASMGSGVSNMFETTMVAILVSALCALIREYGGFDALLNGIRRVFRGKKGGQLGMGLLVGAMDISTANNTVAIVMANPIAKEMAEEYGVSPRKTASILDIFSCVFQGIIPYGAQMLVAISTVTNLGHTITAFEIMRYLTYPIILLVSTLIFIFIIPERKKK